ncbi:MAG: hypothetical protein FWC89_07920 [Defluviitaleaceae bacterium]|nr:hypothetical protein [Defluviitaleaceae bacterium]
MQKKLTTCLLCVVFIFLASCGGEDAGYSVYEPLSNAESENGNEHNENGEEYFIYETEQPEEYQKEDWRSVFAALLREYATRELGDEYDNRLGGSFFMHDINRSGIPVLIIANSFHFTNYIAAYTFVDGNLVQLSVEFFDDYSPIILAPTENRQGLVTIFGEAWISGATFLVIDEDRLKVENRLLSFAGWGTDDGEHKWQINGVEVTEEEYQNAFAEIFGFEEQYRFEQERIYTNIINESNIQKMIYGWGILPVDNGLISFPPAFPISETTELWQIAYAAILYGYAERGNDVRFLLHDINRSGIPDLIVVDAELQQSWSTHEAAYTIRNDRVFLLDSLDVHLSSVFNSEIFYVAAGRDNYGIITAFGGTLAGRLGQDFTFLRMVIDGNDLIVDAHADRYVDTNLLRSIRGMLDDLDQNADFDELQAVIARNTQYFLDGEVVTPEEIGNIFRKGRPLPPLFLLTNDTACEIICDAIFSFLEIPQTSEIRTVTTSIHESLPAFTFYHRTETYSNLFPFPVEENYIYITIVDEFGDLIQEIAVSVDLPPHSLDVIVQFDDYNFDGFLDMRLLESSSWGLGFPWESYYFWQWDTETSQFVPNERLQEITRYTLHSIDPENRRIITGRHSRAGAHSFTFYYEYVNGDFVRVAEYEMEYFGMSGRGHFHGMTRTIHTDFTTGEVTLTLQSNIDPLSDEAINAILQKSNERITWTHENSDSFTQTEWESIVQIHELPRGFAHNDRGVFRNYFHNENLVRRVIDVELFQPIGSGIRLYMYFNDDGDLIFAKATHRDSFVYYIYFYNEAVIHFTSGNDTINLATNNFDNNMIHAITLVIENSRR